MRPPIQRGNVEKVKRNLFGTPTKEDKEAFQRTYEETMAEGRKEMQQKYNFDFRLEMPIILDEENYDWEEVNCDEVPAVFQPQILTDRKNILSLRCERKRLSTVFNRTARQSLKRQSIDAFAETNATVAEPMQQPRKHRRLTGVDIDSVNVFRSARNTRKQRRISDVFELKRSRPSPTKRPSPQKLSPRSTALAKISEMPNLTIMRQPTRMVGTPERMLTRATTSVIGRNTRRRTLA